jgi:cation transport regulator ChaB
MPYKPENPPEKLKNMPKEAQEIWVKIFNSAFEQYKGRDDQEALANATAYAGLKKSGWGQDKEGNWIKTEQNTMTAMELAIWEAYSQTYELKDVEVFATGKWNGHEITDQDLDDIVNNTNEIINKLKPMVKLGHDDKQRLLQNTGLPAGGWITKLKKVGDKILVNIKEVPKVLYQLIQNGAYKRISSEILNDYTEPSTKKTYKKVLSAIAFLGGDLPAVTNLKDIAALFDSGEKANIIIYEKVENSKNNKKRKEIFIMPNGIKVTEVDGKKFVAVEDYEKLEQDKETVDQEKKAAEEYKAKFEAEQKKAKEKEDELAKITAEKRATEIKTFVESNCSESTMHFLPKQKEVLMALMESTSDEKKIKFTEDRKEVELSQRELLGKFIELQPNFSDSIFAELSKDGEEEEGEDKLSLEEKEVQKYMAEHKDVKYRDAVLAVLDSTEEKKK